MSWCAHFFSPLIRDWSKPPPPNRVDDGGSERPAGASRATDADSALQARSSLDASLNNVFHGCHNWHCRRESEWRTAVETKSSTVTERLERHNKVGLNCETANCIKSCRAPLIAHLEDGHLMSAQLGFLSRAGPHNAFAERSPWIGLALSHDVHSAVCSTNSVRQQRAEEHNRWRF